MAPAMPVRVSCAVPARTATACRLEPLTVNVAANAPPSITNVANVSSGDDANLANNASTDIAVLAPAVAVVPVPTLSDWTLLLLAVLLGATWSKDVWRGAGWFALALAPCLNLQPGSQWIADRYLFLPLLGACWVLAA